MIHYSFLGDGRGDPRPDLVLSLQDKIGSEGSIIVYNQAFERKILSDLGEAFPVHADWIKQASDRIVDLYDPFGSFSYYHPDQRGLSSLKVILPILTGKSYKGLSVSNGEEAYLAYLALAGYLDEEADIMPGKTGLQAALETYCGMDTEAMAEVLEALVGIVKVPAC
jgi:hypothetical protein